jgi:hypothetical protein
VTSPPLSMTAPPPSASEMFVLKPARSMLAPASTVVCGALPRRNEKLCVGGRDRAGLDVSAANGEGDDTAGISMPENSSVFPERPDIQYRICVDGIIGRVFVQRCSMRGGDRRSLSVMISFAVPSSSPTLKARVSAPSAPPLPMASVPAKGSCRQHRYWRC